LVITKFIVLVVLLETLIIRLWVYHLVLVVVIWKVILVLIVIHIYVGVVCDASF